MKAGLAKTVTRNKYSTKGTSRPKACTPTIPIPAGIA